MADLDRQLGYDATRLPPDADTSRFPAELDFQQIAIRDLEHVVTCDAIHLLDGWQEAPGARAEACVASWLGKLRVDENGQVWHENILEEALRLTSSDRQAAYGHPAHHFGRTAAALTARFSGGPDPLFRRTMSPQEWGLMVAVDKLVGRGEDTRNVKRDSLVDCAGYCRTVEMVMEAQ